MRPEELPQVVHGEIRRLEMLIDTRSSRRGAPTNHLDASLEMRADYREVLDRVKKLVSDTVICLRNRGASWVGAEWCTANAQRLSAPIVSLRQHPFFTAA